MEFCNSSNFVQKESRRDDDKRIRQNKIFKFQISSHSNQVNEPYSKHQCSYLSNNFILPSTPCENCGSDHKPLEKYCWTRRRMKDERPTCN